jgi:hypothetical protein
VNSPPPDIYWLDRRQGQPAEDFLTLRTETLSEPLPPWPATRWLAQHRLLWLQGHSWSGIDGAMDKLAEEARAAGRPLVRIPKGADPVASLELETGALLLIQVGPDIEAIPLWILRKLEADPQAAAVLAGPPTRVVSLPDGLGVVLSPAPLRREDVRELVVAANLDPDVFFAQVRQLRLEALASRLGPLKVLLRTIQTGSLDRLRAHTGVVRELAGALPQLERLALLSVFSDRDRLTLGDEQGLNLRDLPDIPESIVCEPLLEAHPQLPGWTWALPTLRDHLAAQALLASTSDTARILSLLLHPRDQRVPPRLQRVAGWLADLGSAELRGELIRRDPVAALEGTPGSWSHAERSALVETLFGREIGSSQVSVQGLRQLAYPTLAQQLESPIVEAGVPRSRRMLALDIAGLCGTRELAIPIARVALQSADPQVREAALGALGLLRHREAACLLRPLLEDLDLSERLWSLALMTMWECEALSAPQLFARLRLRPDDVEQGMISWRLAREIVPGLDRAGLVAALEWAMAVPDDYWPMEVAAPLARRLAETLAEDIDLRLRVADVVLHELENFRPHLDQALAATLDPSSRRALIETLLTRSSEQTWLGSSALLMPADLPWLLDQVGPEAPNTLLRALHALLSRADEEQSRDFLARYQAEPTRYSMLRDWVGRVPSRPAPTPPQRALESVTSDVIARELEQAVGLAQEAPGAWGNVLHWMAVRPGDRVVRDYIPRPFADLPGWARVDLRPKLVEAAKLYVERTDPETDTWFGHPQLPTKVILGLRALELVDLEHLALDVLGRWAAAIVVHGQTVCHKNLMGRLSFILLDRLPQAVDTVVSRWLDSDFNVGTNISTLRNWFRTPGISADLMARFEQGKFEPSAEGEVLQVLLDWDIDDAWRAALWRLERGQLTLPVASAMLKCRPKEAWRVLWSWLLENPERRWILSEMDVTGRDVFSVLDDDQLAELYLWLDTVVPHVEWPREAVAVGGDLALDLVRSRVFGTLAARSTWSAVAALERIVAVRPHYQGLRAVLAEVRGRARDATPYAPTPRELLGLLARPNARLVRSEAQLVEVVQEGLARLRDLLASQLPRLYARDGEGRRTLSVEALLDPTTHALSGWLKDAVIGARVGVYASPAALVTGADIVVEATPDEGPPWRLGVQLVMHDTGLSRRGVRATNASALLVLLADLDARATLPTGTTGQIVHLPILERPRDFARGTPWGDQLLGALQREGFELRALHSAHSERSWVLRVGIPPHVREQLGLAEELLVLAVADELRGQDIEFGRRELLRNGVQVEPELVVAVDGAPGLEGRLARLRGAGAWVPWPIRDERAPTLREQLETYLPTYDVFDQHLPVRLAEVYGRQEEVADLSARILRGASVGVFGLRKVGKTTAVRAVTDRLDPTSAPEGVGPEGTNVRALVAWIDAQGVRREHVRDLLGRLGRRLAERAQRAGLDVDPPEPTPEGLEQLLQAVLAGSSLPICVVIDECDFLFVGDSGEGPIPGIASVLGMLRALSQVQGRLSVVLIGRDPTVTQTPILEGVPNPFLSWFSVRWLGPLQREAADEMLTHLGARCGLDVSASTCALAWRWTGGHAYLHRQFGSALRGAAGGRRVDTTELEACAVERFEERSEVESAATEILSLLEVHFPAAYSALLALSAEGTRREVLNAHGGFGGPGALALRRLGLLARDGDELWIPELVATRARWMPRPRRIGAG